MCMLNKIKAFFFTFSLVLDQWLFLLELSGNLALSILTLLDVKMLMVFYALICTSGCKWSNRKPYSTDLNTSEKLSPIVLKYFVSKVVNQQFNNIIKNSIPSASTSAICGWVSFITAGWLLQCEEQQQKAGSLSFHVFFSSSKDTFPRSLHSRFSPIVHWLQLCICIYTCVCACGWTSLWHGDG